MRRAIVGIVVVVGGCEASPPLVSQVPPGPLYACGAAPAACSGANCVLNVRDYGAAGNGKGDDTKAIQCAIDAASNPKLFPQGAAVYLPAGKYPLSIASSSCGGGAALAIRASNIRLFGDGDSSVLYVPTWEKSSGAALELTEGYIAIGSASADVDNVVLERFAFVGPLHSSSSPDGTYADAVQIGSASQTHVVNFSGVRDMLFQGTATAIGMLGGPPPGQGNIPAVQASGDFVVESRFTDLEGGVVGCRSAEYVDTLVRGNVLRSIEGLAFESWSGRILIEGNVIDDARGGAIAFNQDPSSVGWSIVSGNSITTIGRGISPPAPAIQLGETVPAYRVMITENVIQNAYGSGIFAFQACEADIEDNTVDGFGLGATGMTGIAAYNIYCGSRVVGNHVVCTSSDAGCAYGLITGGSVGQNAWSDGNTVAGVTNLGGTAFVTNQSSGDDGAGANGTGGYNIFNGRNVDMDTGLDAPMSDDTDTPNMPIRFVTGGSYSVAGSKVWRLYNAAGSPVAITGLTGCTIGESVTLLFNGTSATTLTDDGTGGPFDLNGDFTAPADRNSILSLLCVSPNPPTWVEVSRSND